MRSFHGNHAWPRRIARGLLPLLLAGAVGLAAGGCKEEALQHDANRAAPPGGLTPAQAAMVVARVGDKNITLGEFAATLERMDQFDRLRYQTPERRKELLDQMITVELLAREARQRGLDKKPETQAAMRQIMRDAMLADARKSIRGPGDLPEAEVRAYYEAHKSDFMEPERRRVSQLVTKDKQTAQQLIDKAKDLSAAEWGALVVKQSADPHLKGYKGPAEMAGNLGIVGPPDDERGANPRVPDELRDAAFKIGQIGQVYGEPVQGSDGQWHVVRLTSKTDAHARSFAEAERSIRITMTQEALSAAEKQLEAELRKKLPVVIDEKALSDVALPAPSKPKAPHGMSPHGDPHGDDPHGH